MTPRDRVIATIRHEKPDRIPITAWLRLNLAEEIAEAFGSVEAFEDRFEFDAVTLIAMPHQPYPLETKEQTIWPHRKEHGEILPAELLDVPMSDPNDMDKYDAVKEWVRHHKEERGRFVGARCAGPFEGLNSPFGFENQLMYLVTHTDGLRDVYRRYCDWAIAYANNCFDLGVDMLLFSDDWGAQDALMFSPKTWRELIYPAHQRVVAAVHARPGKYIGLHSDGNNLSVLDGIAELGYDVFHPFQESAGMDLALFRETYRKRFTVMGGIDVQSVMGFGDLEKVRHALERVIGMFSDGGLILCTSHAVQKHCSMEELEFTFQTAYDMVRERGGGSPVKRRNRHDEADRAGE